MRFKHALLYALLAMALVIIFFAITECCIEPYETEYIHKNIHPNKPFREDFEIDDTVWEREPTKKGGETL